MNDKLKAEYTIGLYRLTVRFAQTGNRVPFRVIRSRYPGVINVAGDGDFYGQIPNMHVNTLSLTGSVTYWQSGMQITARTHNG